LYAAFDHGAVGATGQERVSLALTTVAAVGAAAWIWSGALILRAPALVWSGVALLAALAVWSGVSLTWSVAPEQTWSECNRVVTYLLVLVLAISVGSSHPRASEVVATGLLTVALAVTAYALAQKVLPGAHVGGIFNLDQTGPLTRLQEPLGYWNALALFIAMAVPVALSRAVDRRQRPATRIAMAVGMSLMILTMSFTYSRGGVLALVCGLGAGIWLSGARLRSLAWLGLICATTAPIIVIGLVSHNLITAGVALDTRELAGLELAGVVVACDLVLVLVARRLIVLERRARVSRRGARRIGRALLTAAATLLAIALLVVALSPRGLTGTASHAWSSFTTTRAAAVSQPGRLLSADSANRWVWWKEATRAFGDRPVLGWGAGSFAVVHLLYRRDRLSVQQPHSVPLQFLSELGLVGALVGLGGWIMLIIAGVAVVRRTEATGPRLVAAGLLAGAIVYSVHALYDWDWDIPAVTLPALIILGMLGGSLARWPGPGLGRLPGGGLGRWRGGGRERFPAGNPVRAPAPWLARGIGIGVALVCLTSFAVSVITPRIAADRAAHALVAASQPSGHDLHRALASAIDASNLDPLSDAGLKAASTIAVHLGRTGEARRFMLKALGRQPTDVQAWQQLVFEDLATGADREALAAAHRMQMLDPRGGAGDALARDALLALSAPTRSAPTTVTAP
jgi:hypothetical protein